MSKIEDHLAELKANAAAGKGAFRFCGCGTCQDAVKAAEKMLMDFATQGHCAAFTELVLFVAVTTNQPVNTFFTEVHPAVRLQSLSDLMSALTRDDFVDEYVKALIMEPKP